VQKILQPSAEIQYLNILNWIFRWRSGIKPRPLKIKFYIALKNISSMTLEKFHIFYIFINAHHCTSVLLLWSSQCKKFFSLIYIQKAINDIAQHTSRILTLPILSVCFFSLLIIAQLLFIIIFDRFQLIRIHCSMRSQCA
jgi:hypothetical protein